MKKLGERNYQLISSGVSATGTFNPDECFFYFEESLYCGEVDEIDAFLKWMHKNGKVFGSGNYEEVFAEFKDATHNG